MNDIATHKVLDPGTVAVTVGVAPRPHGPTVVVSIFELAPARPSTIGLTARLCETRE